MSILKKLADNVILVDFNNKDICTSGRKELFSNPFAMFVDENSTNLDDFCNALLTTSSMDKKTTAGKQFDDSMKNDHTN